MINGVERKSTSMDVSVNTGGAQMADTIVKDENQGSDKGEIHSNSEKKGGRKSQVRKGADQLRSPRICGQFLTTI